MTVSCQTTRRAAALAAVVAAALAGCTTVPSPARPRDPVGAAVAQPFRDLSLVQDALPAGLEWAAADPYRSLASCADLQAELAALDGWLGPDVDAPAAERDGAAAFLGDVVTGAASLPFRGLVRRVTGAKRRDEALAAVLLAAMVRRGFLKGQRAALDCRAPGA